jgi:hypothetical protein
MKTKETVRTFVTKSGDTWEWVETPEFVKAIEIYWQTVKENNERN